MASQSVDLNAGVTELQSTSSALVISGKNKVQISLDSSALSVASSASVERTYTAGSELSALRAVYYNMQDGRVYYGSPDNLVAASIIGITKTSAHIGDPVVILQYGVLEDPFFNFNPAQIVCLGADGVLLFDAPQAGYLSRLGRAINQTALLITIEIPIQI